MPRKRLHTYWIRELLRLKHAGRSQREIARSLGISGSTVSAYGRRAEAAGLSWPLPDDLEDDELEAALFPAPPQRATRPEPDWERVHLELLRRDGATRRQLWMEYREEHPDGYQYSRFCDLFKEWLERLD